MYGRKLVEKSGFSVAPGSHPAEQAYPVLVPGGLRVAGLLDVTACLAQSKISKVLLGRPEFIPVIRFVGTV
jgi:hypothetical protein